METRKRKGILNSFIALALFSPQKMIMDELSERQKLILTLVIHEYVSTAVPVGSHSLVKAYQLDMSSATVRNEMGLLTELGYLRQPHTSAGRVPTEQGYRYFVGRLMQKMDLPDSTRRMISHQFYQSHQDIEQWMRLAASILAHQSRAASLVTAPHLEQMRLKHMELIATRGRQVLMVLVLSGGEVHQRVTALEESFTQEQLSSLARSLTNRYHGKDVGSIRAELNRGEHASLAEADGLRNISDYGTISPVLEAQITAYLLEELDQADRSTSGEVYLDGMTNVLLEPEFSDSEDARRALRVLEERTLLGDLLQRTALASSAGDVQVLIGGEGLWDDLRQCSIILAPYGTPGLATGALGVLGPMRMSYGRTISTVRYLSVLLSDLISETLME